MSKAKANVDADGRSLFGPNGVIGDSVALSVSEIGEAASSVGVPGADSSDGDEDESSSSRFLCVSSSLALPKEAAMP